MGKRKAREGKRLTKESQLARGRLWRKSKQGRDADIYCVPTEKPTLIQAMSKDGPVLY